MRSIIYAGHDFSELCSAEVVSRSVNPIIAEALEAPGRAGAMLVSGYVPPSDVTVRLFLDLGFRADVNALADARHRLSFWLCAFGGDEAIIIDCADESVRINDADARDCVALGSDFFSLEPGDRIRSITGCSYHETRFTERWA